MGSDYVIYYNYSVNSVRINELSVPQIQIFQ